MKRVYIEANTLPDAWFQLVYNILEQGRVFKIDQGSFAGSKRLEFDWIDVLIKHPYLRDTDGFPLIPEMPDGLNIPAPTTKEYIADYAEYIMGTEMKENESYTYGSRLRHVDVPRYIIDAIFKGNPIYKKYPGLNYIESLVLLTDKVFDQVEAIIETYKTGGHRNNQMVLQVADRTDLLLLDPPCLRHIDTRIQDNKLHFFIYFRSWDLWGGFPSNLAGISMLHEYMATEIGVEQGEFICTSKGLHLYDYSVDVAKLRCYWNEEEEKENKKDIKMFKCPKCKSKNVDWGYDLHYIPEDENRIEVGQEGVCEECGTRIYIRFKPHKLEWEEEDQETGEVLSKDQINL